jgi:O-antigen/teichoic acid export membrane protein
MSNVTAESVSRRVVRGAGWVFAWRLATRNLGLLSTLVLVRLLQPSDFGLVALATGFTDAVDALLAIGVQDALVRAPIADRDMYDTGFGLSVLRGVLTAALIAALAWPIGAFFDDPRLVVVMLALSVGALMSAFENIGIVDFRRDLAFRKEFNMQLWSRIASVAITLGIAVVWPTYWALVVGILVNRALRLAQSYVMSPYRPRIALRAWRRIIGFSLWTWAQGMLVPGARPLGQCCHRPSPGRRAGRCLRGRIRTGHVGEYRDH